MLYRTDDVGITHGVQKIGVTIGSYPFVTMTPKEEIMCDPVADSKILRSITGNYKRL
jgi:hypothetical protein